MEKIAIDPGVIRTDVFTNCRKVDPADPSITKLAQSLRKDKQWSPLIVWDMEGKGEYHLIAGFRRHAAMTLTDGKSGASVSGIDKADCLVYEGDEAGARLLNIGENAVRRNLTSYELAKAFCQLSDAHGLSAEQIGKRIAAGEADGEGFSGRYVSNMMRYLRREKLGPMDSEIEKAWEADTRGDVFTQAVLKELAVLPASKQRAWYEAARDAASPYAGMSPARWEKALENPAPEPGANPEPLPPPFAVKRGAKMIELARAHFARHEGDEFSEGAAEALAWVLGNADTVRDFPGTAETAEANAAHPPTIGGGAGAAREGRAPRKARKAAAKPAKKGGKARRK